MVKTSEKLKHRKADDLITEIEAFAITLVEIRQVTRLIAEKMNSSDGDQKSKCSEFLEILRTAERILEGNIP